MTQEIKKGDLVFFDKHYWTVSHDYVETVIGIVVHVRIKTTGYASNKRITKIYQMLTPQGLHNVYHESMTNIIVNKLK